jgi:hypothetical protein
MKSLNRARLVMLVILSTLTVSPCRAQTKPQTTEKNTAAAPETDAQKKNLQVYVDLLRKDIRQQKAEIMGAVMLLRIAGGGNRGCYWRARRRCGWYRDCRLQEGRAVTNPERIFARVPAGAACGAPSGGIVWSDSAALRCGRSVRRDVLPYKPIVLQPDNLTPSFYSPG